MVLNTGNLNPRIDPALPKVILIQVIGTILL